MRTEYKIRFIISTNVTKGSPEQLRNIFKTRRGCYVKRTGSEHKSHLLSDGTSGIIGVLAKAVNQQTLNQMLKAAGNMSKSTHRLIKLVRAKYEHACMVHDSVENTNAFVEKYIYEYRGFLFGIHTWRQMELLTVWFVGILAALGAFECYITYGFSDAAYQYIETGLAEMVLLLLSVIFQTNSTSLMLSGCIWWIILRIIVHFT